MKNKDKIEKMVNLFEKVSVNLKESGQEIENIGYYKDFEFKGAGLGVNDVFIVKLKDIDSNKVPKSRDNETGKEKALYEIYDADNNLIASVDEMGEVEFSAEYIEDLEQNYKEYMDTLELEEAEFELPDELEKEDLVLTDEELEEKHSERRVGEVSKILGNKEIDSYSEVDVNQTPQFNDLTNKQELDANVRVTQTETLSDLIPELKEKGIVRVGIVFTDSLNKYNTKEQNYSGGQRKIFVYWNR